MAWVVEVSGYDQVAAQEKTVRFAMGEGIAFTDAAYAPGALMRWTSASQKIGFDQNGVVKTQGDTGEVMIANFPDDVWSEAPWDALKDWIWQNRIATLYYVPAKVWAARTAIARATLEQPIANLDTKGGASSVIRMPLRDPRAALETPLQPVKYAGTNVGPVGVEGGPELKGRPKPIVYGLVSNISPPLVNASLLIYQIADVSVNVLCVRDGGVPLGVGTVRGSLASLVASAAPSGKYDIYKGAEGTFIKLGSSTIFNLTVDADEAVNAVSQSHPYIWARLRQRIDPAVLLYGADDAILIDAAGAGFYWDSEITAKDAVDEVLGSFSGYETQRLDGYWFIFKLVIPSGTPQIELVQLGPTTKLKATSRKLLNLNSVRPQYAPDGAPPFRVTVNWGRNYTVMSTGDFAGATIQRLKDKFSQEYRAVTATNTAIWDPVAKTGPWKNAPELTINTAYQPSTGGLVSTGAQAEADRLLALLGPLRAGYQVSFRPEPTDFILPGAVVQVTYPRMGLAAGKLFRVLEAGLTVERDIATCDMVIGLQA